MNKQEKKIASNRVIKFSEKFDSIKFGIHYRIFSEFGVFLSDYDFSTVLSGHQRDVRGRERVANNDNQFWVEEVVMKDGRCMGSADNSPTWKINGVELIDPYDREWELGVDGSDIT